MTDQDQQQALPALEGQPCDVCDGIGEVLVGVDVNMCGQVQVSRVEARKCPWCGGTGRQS
jgi:hypothetical protein